MFVVESKRAKIGFIISFLSMTSKIWSKNCLVLSMSIWFSNLKPSPTTKTSNTYQYEISRENVFNFIWNTFIPWFGNCLNNNKKTKKTKFKNQKNMRLKSKNQKKNVNMVFRFFFFVVVVVIYLFFFFLGFIFSLEVIREAWFRKVVWSCWKFYQNQPKCFNNNNY